MGKLEIIKKKAAVIPLSKGNSQMWTGEEQDSAEREIQPLICCTSSLLGL